MKIELQELGFKVVHAVQGRYSIADLYKPHERCGIYVLCFANGQYYVGQAKDVVRRYTQHRKNYGDITEVTFKKVGQNRLNEEEKRIAQHLQSVGYSLRNIQLVSIMEGETDFDGIMSPQEQKQWVADTSLTDLHGEKFEIEEHRKKYTKNFQKLSRIPHFIQYSSLLAKYVASAIPCPIRSEYSFWSVSCPSYSYNLLGRININWQEVSSWLVHDNELWASFHVAESPLVEAYGYNMFELRRQIPSVDEMTKEDGHSHRYEPGGQDQICLTATGTDIGRLLDLEPFKLAMRTFNMRLIRKGPTIYNRYHCFDLSRLISEQMRNP